ncbi:MAG: hypothetical protein Kow0092_16720 [Deferrisomatales bacterium]
MRKTLGFLVLLGIQTGVALALFASVGPRRQAVHARRRPALRELVGRLGLTDFAVWTEARYTRHPSQADRFSAFQDFPGAMDHFPAGSVVGPPRFRAGPAARR